MSADGTPHNRCIQRSPIEKRERKSRPTRALVSQISLCCNGVGAPLIYNHSRARSLGEVRRQLLDETGGETEALRGTYTIEQDDRCEASEAPGSYIRNQPASRRLLMERQQPDSQPGLLEPLGRVAELTRPGQGNVIIRHPPRDPRLEPQKARKRARRRPSGRWSQRLSERLRSRPSYRLVSDLHAGLLQHSR